MLDEAICPACDHKGLRYNAEQIELPYLGESLETMIRCEACGYRHTDFILVDIKDPVRHKYTVQTEADMSVRVVRASSGTIRIPELGIDIEPGVASDAFISNVEGILFRVEKVLSQLYNDAEDGEQQARIEALQQTMLAMRDGKAQPVTLVIEDPFGNSGILHDDTVIEPLSEEEAAKLKTGAFIIEQSELNPEEEE